MNGNPIPTPYRDASFDQLWNQDPTLLRMLGLAPLVIIGNSTVAAIAVGLATMLVLTLSALLVSLLRHHLSAVLRLTLLLLVFTTLASCAAVLLQAYAYTLYPSIAAFVPLIIGNGVLLGRSDSFAANSPALPATVDALKTSARFLLLVVMIGTLRELLGTGAILANIDQLLPVSRDWRIEIFSGEPAFLLALQPAGALLLLGLLCALKKLWDKRRVATTPAEPPVPPGSKRVRVTGQI